MKKPKAIVVEVTTEGFELSDGRFYPQIYGKRASENKKKKSHLSVVSGGES